MTIDQREAMEIARDPWHTALDPSDILLTDQVAVVTGGGAGIGQGIALGLARFGADVAVFDIDPDRAQRTADAVSDLGRAALPVAVDMMDTDAVTGAVARAAEHFGKLTILVNNAGGVRGAAVPRAEPAQLAPAHRHQPREHARRDRCGAPVMIEAGGGSIVNVTSIEALRAAPMYAVYAACKAGMVNFTMTMALELAEHNIRINAIAPDQTITPGLRGNRPARSIPRRGSSAAPSRAACCARSRWDAKGSSRSARRDGVPVLTDGRLRDRRDHQRRRRHECSARMGPHRIRRRLDALPLTRARRAARMPSRRRPRTVQSTAPEAFASMMRSQSQPRDNNSSSVSPPNSGAGSSSGAVRSNCTGLATNGSSRPSP